MTSLPAWTAEEVVQKLQDLVKIEGVETDPGSYCRDWQATRLCYTLAQEIIALKARVAELEAANPKTHD